MTKKKIARKIATYAMAASMIGGSILGSGITGVSAAEKYPTAKTSYSKTVADTDYKQAYLDYISQFIKAPEITSATAKTVWGYILSTYDETITFKEAKFAKSYQVQLSWNKDFTKDSKTGFTPITVKTDQTEGEGKISADIMTSAVVISSWYTDEYKKLFALPDESELQLQDARELLDWLIEECRGECPPRVRKNYILQCGPGRFRNRKKLNVLLNILASQLRLSVVQEGKTTYVLLSEINNITLPELNACYSQKLIRWHEQSFGL